MKCYVVSESELKQIGLANLGITIFAAIGSFFVAFGLDLMKDFMLAGQIPESAKVIKDVIQPACLVLGVVFYVAGGLIWLWRHDMVKLIKKESATA